MKHISEFLDSFFERAFTARSPTSPDRGGDSGSNRYRERFIGVPTGFADLDTVTGGLQRSDLIVVAAEPHVGKTAFSLSAICNSVFRYGMRVGLFSLSLSGELVVQRMLSMDTGIEVQRLASGNIDDDEWPFVSNALNNLGHAPLFLNDDVLSLDELLDRARAMKVQSDVDAIVIDSLECIRGGKDALREVSRHLKQLSREMEIPVIVTMSIPSLSRWMKVPVLSDIANMSSLDEDADIVMFIYREELYDPETEKKGIAEIHIAKHRNGPMGTVNLRFFPTIRRFADLEIYRETA